MIERMAEAAPRRDSSTIKKMNDRSLFFSLNIITHYFKNWTTESELNELILTSRNKRKTPKNV